MASDVTKFEEIFEEASYKIEDSKFINDTDEEVEKDFTHLLRDAMGRFDICYNTKKIDFDMQIVSPALTLKEMKITTDLMLLGYMNKVIGNIEDYQLILTTADYKIHSETAMLNQKTSIRNKWLSDIETQILEYGHYKAINKLNKAIKERKYL